MVMEFINILMDLFTKVIGKMISSTEMDKKSGQMVQIIKDNLLMVRNMEKVNFIGKMVVTIKVIFV